MDILLEIWIKFVNWISPFLVPILSVLLLITFLWAATEHVEIYGIHVHLPLFGDVAVVKGYKTDAEQAVKNYQMCQKNEGNLQKALDDQSYKLKEALQKRKDQDKVTNKELEGENQKLQDTLAGKDAKLIALQSMVNNPKFGATACARAQNIINQEIGVPLVKP